MNYSATKDGTSMQPSVKYLVVLLVAEIFLFGLLRGLLEQGG